MIIGIFPYDQPQADWMTATPPYVTCKWNPWATEVTLEVDRNNNLIASVPVPVSFSEHELIHHAHELLKIGVLLESEGEYIELVESKFGEPIFRNVFEKEKIGLLQAMKGWVSSFSAFA